MKLIFTTLLTLLFTFACYAQELSTRANEYLKGYSDRGEFMGSVLVARNGTVLFEKGYGMANLEWDAPNTPQTKFNLASVTKQFTGLAVFQLVERGKLKLDDHVSKYYHDAPATWQEITIYHLLTHTAGIPNPKGLDDFSKGIAQPYTPLELIKLFRDKPLDFPPGTQRKYSNPGYYLLGFIIEQVSGQKYADYIRQNIFEPLEMNESGYESTTAIQKHHAEGYAADKTGLSHADYLDWSIPYAAGALYSTVEDMLRWDQAFYTKKLLSQQSLDRLFTPDSSGYNYGWFIDTKGKRIKIYHEGSNPGYAAYIARYPEDRTFVIVLSNLETSRVSKIADDLAKIAWGEAIPTNDKKKEGNRG